MADSICAWASRNSGSKYLLYVESTGRVVGSVSYSPLDGTWEGVAGDSSTGRYLTAKQAMLSVESKLNVYASSDAA